MSSDNVSLPSDNDDFLKSFTEDIQQWVLGVDTDTPEQVRKAMEGVVEKLNCTVAIFVLQKLADMSPLMNYLKMAGPEIYSGDDFVDRNDDGQLQNLANIERKYRGAQKELNVFLDFTRKFALQNKELLHSPTSQMEEDIMRKIRSLPPSLLEKMDSALNKMTDGSGQDI